MPNFIRLKQINQPELSGFFIDSTTTLTSGITESIINNTLTDKIVLTTGAQNISGIKNFGSKPTVNNIPVVLSNELSAGQDLSTFVLRTGDQTISGIKTFTNTINIVSGINPQSIRVFDSTGINSGEFGLFGWQNDQLIIGTQQSQSGILRNVLITGRDIIINSSGNLNIFDPTNISGNLNVSGTGIFKALDLSNIGTLNLSGIDINFNSIDNLNLSGIDIIVSGGSVNLLTNNFTVANKPVTDRVFGPYILNRRDQILFDSSNYLPTRDGVALSNLSLTAPAGNSTTPGTLGYYGMFNFLSTTAEGIFPGFVNPFNPFRVFGANAQYRINAYVYVTNILNDGLHCMLRSVTNDGNNNLTETTIRWNNNNIEFGAGAGSANRVYLAESQLITASTDQFINYKLYLGAYARSNPSDPNSANNGIVQDVVIYFNRDV